MSGEKCSLQKTCGHCFLDQPLGQLLYKKKSVVEHLGFLKDFLEEFGLGTRSNTIKKAQKSSPVQEDPVMFKVYGNPTTMALGIVCNLCQYLRTATVHPLGSLITNLSCHEVGYMSPMRLKLQHQLILFQAIFGWDGCWMYLPPPTFFYYPTWCDVG